jgi:hypothetical protein
MITAIFTDQKTTLTIETPEELNLEQLGLETPLARLVPGVNQVVVGAGVFKVLSKTALRVSADAPNLYVASTLNTKDSGFPDPPRLPVTTSTQLREFLIDARSEPAPR